MKTLIVILIVLLPTASLFAQRTSIPDVNLRDLDGNLISADEISNSGDPTLLIFWKASSGKCCENLETFRSVWEETLVGYGINMVAICIDCNGSWTQVKPIVYGNNWDFETYIDVNGDFKRALNVGDAPCTMLFDGDQNLLCRMNSVCAGSDEFICANILGQLNIHLTNNNYQAEK
ncbi:MAG: redoxin domain-containing protein [Bacteroidales bacterium]|jgi:peroxiredoxin|nr:redoxin domain-containing protein [Bacteroidales bacterium]